MSSSPTAHAVDPHHARRWLILAVLGTAQLMVILDATIVNIALPTAQADLGFSDEHRPWIITAYALAFGSLLLLGGRLGDLLGRKRMFLTGLVGFAVASAIGGAAQSFGVLVTARVLQGVFGAILAPAALSLLATTFTDPAERAKAFGIFAAVSGVGAGVGLLLGGVLTETLSWRWCLYVNLVFAAPAALGALSLLHGGTHHHDGERARLDIPGTATVTVGLFALVYGFSRAETDGWTDPVTVVALAAALALIAVFVAIERRVPHPLLPLRVVLDRDRGGSFLALGIVSIGIFGISLFLTYFMQQSLGFSPIETGLAFMPMNATVMFAVGLVSAKLLPAFGPRPVIAGGLAISAVAAFVLTFLEGDSGYATGVLPGLLLFGLGFGAVFGAGLNSATAGLEHRDSGVGSAMVNTSQQVGGSIGIALLSTVAAGAASSFAEDRAPGGARLALDAAAHGYSTGFWWAAGIFAVVTVVCGLLLRPGVSEALASSERVVGAH